MSCSYRSGRITWWEVGYVILDSDLYEMASERVMSMSILDVDNEIMKINNAINPRATNLDGAQSYGNLTLP